MDVGGWRPGAGRKPIDPTGQRLVRCTFTVKEEHEGWLRSCADRLGISQSEMLRRILELFSNGTLTGKDLEPEEIPK